MTDALLQRLLSLPDPLSPEAEELDYGSLTFSADELAEMAAFLEGAHDLGDHPESDLDHAAIQSWRILGSTDDPGYLDLYVSLLRSATGGRDDLYCEDFVHLVRNLGDPAIAPLLDLITDPDEPEDFREELTDGLHFLAAGAKDPAALATRIAAYLDDEYATRDLNAYLICILTGLKATNHVDSIRRSLARNQVNVSITGDLEDVEIALGLRETRSTPKPDYPDLEARLLRAVRLGELGPPPAGDDYLAVLDYYLRLYGSEHSLASVCQLDGFVLACVAAPSLVMPSIYLPVIWDAETADPGAGPTWESMDEAQAFFDAVMALHNAHAEALHEGVHHPLAATVIGPDGRELVLYSHWALGVARGTEFWGDSCTPLIGDLAGYLSQILGIESQSDPPEPGETDAPLDCALELIQQVFDERDGPGLASGQFRPPSAPAHRETPKIGRNDPCPCGSGRKFKKCCMN